MSDRARAVSSAEISHVIVRACAHCGCPRTQQAPCAGCGNPDPPRADRLGVTNAAYRNPLRRWWWHLARRHLANLRVRRANAAAAGLRAPRGG